MSDFFTGQIILFGGNYAIRGWAACSGQLLPISQHDALFSLLGTTFGGDGRTTFGLPELRSSVPLHQGHGPGLSPRIMGQRIGTETATIDINTMANHPHDVQASTADADSEDPTDHVLATTTSKPYTPVTPTDDSLDGAVIQSTGEASPDPHYNLMPYLALNFQICLEGIYPARN